MLKDLIIGACVVIAIVDMASRVIGNYIDDISPYDFYDFEGVDDERKDV